MPGGMGPVGVMGLVGCFFRRGGPTAGVLAPRLTPLRGDWSTAVGGSAPAVRFPFIWLQYTQGHYISGEKTVLVPARSKGKINSNGRETKIIIKLKTK